MSAVCFCKANAVLDSIMQDNNYYSKLQSMILDLKDKINKKEI